MFKLPGARSESNDLIAYEDRRPSPNSIRAGKRRRIPRLQVRNLVKNHNLAKSISDVAWSQFRVWLEYFADKFGKVTVAVPPHYTSQECSNCGRVVKKGLSTRTHTCQCGANLCRDENAAINILKKGLSTTGHVGTHAWGEAASTLVESVLSEKAASMNQESPAMQAGGVSRKRGFIWTSKTQQYAATFYCQ